MFFSVCFHGETHSSCGVIGTSVFSPAALACGARVPLLCANGWLPALVHTLLLGFFSPAITPEHKPRLTTQGWGTRNTGRPADGCSALRLIPASAVIHPSRSCARQTSNTQFQMFRLEKPYFSYVSPPVLQGFLSKDLVRTVKRRWTPPILPFLAKLAIASAPESCS